MTINVPDPLLALSNVNTFYGQAQVHFDLSLTVARGHIVCLLGGNASGKSTTMKIILGLVKPRSGEVTFDDASLIGLTTPQIVRLGIASVPEARRLPVRWRAADGRDGARADEPAADDRDGRADHGPVAALCRPRARADQDDQPGGRVGVHGRAECQPRARDRA